TRTSTSVTSTPAVVVAGRRPVIANSWTVTDRAGICTVSPARARSYARLPSILIADTWEGTCSIAPVRAGSSRWTPSRVSAAPSAARVSPSASSVDVVCPSRIVAVYVLSRPTRWVSSRVARPMPRTSSPVAIGSSVPACPTFRVPASHRTRLTTSCEVSPPGLSTRRRPSGVAAGLFVTWLLIGIGTAGLFVRVGLARRFRLLAQSGEFGVPFSRFFKDRFEVGSGLGNLVEHEIDGRGGAHPEVLAHLGTNEPLRGRERRGGGRPVALLPEHGVEHGGVLQVTGHSDVGDGDEAEPGILDAGVEQLGDDLVDPFGHAPHPGAVSHGLFLTVCWNTPWPGRGARGHGVSSGTFYVRGISRISKVSMVSPSAISRYPRLIPHARPP